VAAAAAASLAAFALAGCGGADGGRSEASERSSATAPRTATSAQAPAAGPVRAADVAEHLEALQRIADRNGGNRAAGTAGDRETADYIAAQLRAAGWNVRFQTVRFPFFEEVARPVLDGLQRGRDFRVLEYSPGGDVRARVRPLDTPACEQAALAPIDEGDIAMVARGTCTFRRKAQNAQREGAAALLVVDREGDEPPAATLARPHGVDIPVVAVTGRAAARLARSQTAVTLRVRTQSEERETRNVIAETAGAERVAMAGAHLDSVEEGPGINDNGSGVAALLEAAERLRDRPGLRLGFWAAEELGLYGSRRYVDDLGRAERRAIRAYVNLDMVGSPRPRPQVYDGDDAIERTLRRAFPGEEGETGLGTASDHASFAAADIPVGGLFTGASQSADPCYHRRCDTARSADAPMTARMSQALTTALPALTR
jgi:aminopeptidase Y